MSLAIAGLACELSGSAVEGPAVDGQLGAGTPLSQEGLVVETPLPLNTSAPLAGSPAGDRDSFAMESLGAGLAALDSYRLSMVIHFEGTGVDGSPAGWELTSERILVSQPPASRFDLTSEGAAASAALSAMTVVHIGPESYLAMPGIGCVTGVAADSAAPASGLVDPDTLLAGLWDARWVGDGQVVNDVVSRHYQFDQQSMPALQERPLEVAGNIYVAEDGRYVTRVTLTAIGRNDFLSPGAMQEGILSLELNVSDVNQPLDVQLPEGCAGGVAYPTLGDAFELTNLGDLVSYKTRLTLEEVVAFYQEQMPAAGWSPAAEAVIFADSAILTFARGEAIVTVNVDPDPQAGFVAVLISP
jgi:hypothetical protein